MLYSKSVRALGGNWTQRNKSWNPCKLQITYSTLTVLSHSGPFIAQSNSLTGLHFCQKENCNFGLQKLKLICQPYLPLVKRQVKESRLEGLSLLHFLMWSELHYQTVITIASISTLMREANSICLLVFDFKCYTSKDCNSIEWRNRRILRKYWI